MAKHILVCFFMPHSVDTAFELLLLLLLLLNVFDDAPVCRHVKDESWAML